MCSVAYVVLIGISQLIIVNSQGEDDIYFETTTNLLLEQEEKKIEKMSDYILKILEHYKQPNPKGLPGAEIPDPYFVPDVRQTLGFGTNLEFKNTALHGANNFLVNYVDVDIRKLECRAAFELDKLLISGNYSVNMWLNSYPGAFTSEILGIKSFVLATLDVQRDGKLRAENISMDMTFKKISVQFENAGFLATLLQGVFNSMGSILYESIKPSLLEDAHVNMREVINNKLDQIVGDIEFPNTISPVDMVIIDIRNKMKDIKMDPIKIEDYNSSIGVFNVALRNTWIDGLSSFHNMGNVSLRLEKNTITADFNIGTKELQGSTEWEVSAINKFISQTGSISFIISYIRGRFVIAQALDTRKRMEFKDLHLDVGNVQIRSDGIGTLDYVLEASSNILPNLLRYQIIEAMQNPIKWKIQQELNHLCIEEAIINALPDIDQMVEEGFQLAALRILNSTNNSYDDDDFFNF